MLAYIPVPPCSCWGRSISAVTLYLRLQPSPSVWAAGGPSCWQIQPNSVSSLLTILQGSDTQLGSFWLWCAGVWAGPCRLTVAQ